MEKWKKTTYMVAIFTFLTELRPLDPYMTAYLTGPDGNLSLAEVIILNIHSILNILKYFTNFLLCCTHFWKIGKVYLNLTH